jgi:hypothetical protein
MLSRKQFLSSLVGLPALAGGSLKSDVLESEFPDECRQFLFHLQYSFIYDLADKVDRA